ncbi:DUF4158 domain-containing protein [Cupriavidus basilensis]
MQGWQSTYLGAREVPRELSSFELQTFFTYSHAEHELIGRQRGPTMKLGLALHIGFLRMSGCLLDAFSILPPVLLRHLGTELGINTPDLASLRALYARRPRSSVRSRTRSWKKLGDLADEYCADYVTYVHPGLS